MQPVHVRWLGRVPYRPALALQRAFHADPARGDHLILLEHPATVTMGRRGSADDVLVTPDALGAELVAVDRGGQTTFHGPGQLVGYPIVNLPATAAESSAPYVRALEQWIILALGDLGRRACTRDGHAGVWIDDEGLRPRKIASIGVRVEHGRTLHGFALNVDPDLSMFDRIVPCGLDAGSLTSLRREGLDVTMREVVDTIIDRCLEGIGPTLAWSPSRPIDRVDVTWRTRPDDLSEFSRSALDASSETRSEARQRRAGVDAVEPYRQRKPEWMRAPVSLDAGVMRTREAVRDAGLVTVCEEAGCPNLSECWSSGTATFMVCGERCTRACGFCRVDTRRPAALDADEPQRVAAAVRSMGLRFAVVTMVARDDLADGGAAHVAATVRAIRAECPGTGIEVLISDLRGDLDALDVVLEARPDVVNHNVETPARLQWVARPSAGYATSLALLGHAALRGSVTKSGLVVGLGETFDEVVDTLGDLAAVGTQIVTIGQYLRPTAAHLPVARWWTPDDFSRWAQIGTERFGLAHVESSPLTRSSYHAADAADASAQTHMSEPEAVPVTLGARST